MKYEIQRAILTEYGVINLGDMLKVEMKNGVSVNCTLIDIYWLDEYTAVMHTDIGKISLADVEYAVKIEFI